MFKNAMFFAASAIAAAYLAPQYLPGFGGADAPQPRSTTSAASQAVSVDAPAASTALAESYREKEIPADAGGQYSVDALIAGQSARMLVDTGATWVVISADLAERLGLSAGSGPKVRIVTANGEASATPVVLPSIDLGSIYMKDVQALIADRSAGPVSLLGASFLKRLASVEQRDGMLILRQ